MKEKRPHRMGPPNTEAVSLVTKQVIGHYDNAGRFWSIERSQANGGHLTREHQQAAVAAQMKSGMTMNKLEKANLARNSPKAAKRREMKKLARDLLDEIIDECGADVKAAAKALATLAKGAGAENQMVQIAAFRAVADTVLQDVKGKANVGGNHITNNTILVSAEDAARSFIASHGGRGRELVAVQAGAQAGPDAVPIGLPARRTERDDHPQGTGHGDGVATPDP